LFSGGDLKNKAESEYHFRLKIRKFPITNENVIRINLKKKTTYWNVRQVSCVPSYEPYLPEKFAKFQITGEGKILAIAHEPSDYISILC